MMRHVNPIESEMWITEIEQALDNALVVCLDEGMHEDYEEQLENALQSARQLRDLLNT